MWTRTPPIVAFPRAPILKPTNDIPLTRRLLKVVLKDLSERLYFSFRRQVRLVVHGGVVMVLHPSFTHRESTQDVDYIHRSFEKEYRALGYIDAGERLRSCIAQTAAKFNLGADWMNAHPDTALPLALECVSSAPTLNIITNGGYTANTVRRTIRYSAHPYGAKKTRETQNQL